MPFVRLLLQTYACPSLRERQGLVALIRDEGFAAPYSYVQGDPALDADAKRPPRVVVLDVPAGWTVEQLSAAMQRLRAHPQVQYLLGT